MLPNASAAGATQVPVAVTGRVMPLIVSSPSTLAVPSSAMSMSCEVKVTSGWLAASKNSPPRTWARNCSGVRIEIDSTFAAPSRRPSTSLASTSSSVPLKSETPW